MSKVSDVLSGTSRINQHPVGLKGGRKASDINGPDTNVLQKPSDDMDNDGSSDFGVTRELSEDPNNRWLKR